MATEETHSAVNSPRHTLLDPEAFAANRRGEMTEDQRQPVRVLARNQAIVATVLLAIGVYGSLAMTDFLPAPRPELVTMAVFGIMFSGVPLLAGTALVLSYHRSSAILREMETGTPQIVTGEVRWTGRGLGYAVQIQDLRGRWSGPVTMLPGTYRFNVLPRSGWLLSAEPLTVPAGSSTVGVLGEILRHVFGVGPEALAANRTGRMSGGQAARLVATAATSATLALLPPVIAGVAAYILLKYLLPSQVNATGIFAAIPSIVIVTSTLKDLRNAVALFVDAAARRVAMAEGEGSPDESRKPNLSFCYRVDSTQVVVSQAAHYALIPHLRYRVYYAPHSRHAVAIEPLGDPA